MDPQTFCKWLAFQVVFGLYHWIVLACIVPLSDRVLLFFVERHLLPWSDQQQARFLHQLPTSCLTFAGVQFCQDFTFEKPKNWLWHPTALKWENRWDRFGQGRLCSTACYSRQRTSTATSKWDIIAWTCLDKRIRKVWSVRGVWYAFSNIFSDRQSDEAKHIEHRRTLKLPRWGKIVRPQPRQRVVTLRAGEFIANALNIFGMDDRKIQKRGP